MTQPYQQRMLGYPRTPTQAVIRVNFSNGEVWEVPAQLMADSRDANYADDKEDTIGYIHAGALNAYHLVDWMSNNMDWSDLVDYARQLPVLPQKINYDIDFVNASKEVRGLKGKP